MLESVGVFCVFVRRFNGGGFNVNFDVLSVTRHEK
jgi:hypothetical protein